MLNTTLTPLIITGASGPGGPEFAEYKEKTQAEHGVKFFTSLADLPETGKKRLALVSGRTADNPKLLSQALKVCSGFMETIGPLTPPFFRILLPARLHLYLLGKTWRTNCEGVRSYA